MNNKNKFFRRRRTRIENKVTSRTVEKKTEKPTKTIRKNNYVTETFLKTNVRIRIVARNYEHLPGVFYYIYNNYIKN